jgi:hypothetical protein
MISRPTVFVLGAGASAPYGFPLGAKLVEQILRDLRPESGTQYVQAVMKAAGAGPDAIDAFLLDLRFSRRSSVDRFLQTRPEYAAIGKAAIAGLLIPRENDMVLAERSDWLAYLLDHMIGDKDPESFKSNNLTVITFNFDRSFERALFLALRASYGLENVYAMELASHVPVYHVHGDLGWPSWMGTPTGSGPAWERDYTPQFDEHALMSAANRIRLIHEEITDQHRLEPMMSKIQEALDICLIGHSFQVANFARLKLNEPLPKATIYATRVDCTNAEAEPAIAFCRPNQLQVHEWDALKFLRMSAIVHS